MVKGGIGMPGLPKGTFLDDILRKNDTGVVTNTGLEIPQVDGLEDPSEFYTWLFYKGI